MELHQPLAELTIIKAENERLLGQLATSREREQACERQIARVTSLLERAKAQLAHAHDWADEKGQEFLRMRSELAAYKAEQEGLHPQVVRPSRRADARQVTYG